ncbi:hypothetical protein [Pelagicoccus albus]|uniref:Uncharacterized protein n=1 Tax=Pelagicoccus albus TaxID=415222 RepID=A0A7X1E9P9_9BACT|nr:hypothetical protein [Pelagicoccus albus]MBC2605992.1 hypothetical protein [Pelagicoccus albus]
MTCKVLKSLSRHLFRFVLSFSAATALADGLDKRGSGELGQLSVEPVLQTRVGERFRIDLRETVDGFVGVNRNKLKERSSACVISYDDEDAVVSGIPLVPGLAEIPVFRKENGEVSEFYLKVEIRRANFGAADGSDYASYFTNGVQ